MKGASQVEWENTLENLGSDHYIIRTSIEAGTIKRKIGLAHLTDWDAFRQGSQQLKGEITSIKEWCRQLKQIQETYTHEIDRTEQVPEVDKRLLGLWEARRGLTKRWKRQKLNKKLKKKIAEITAKAEEYATQLARQSWQQFSSSLQGTLNTAKTWRILKALMDPGKTKAESNKAIQRLIHQYDGTEEQLMEALKNKCYGQERPEEYKGEYQGKKTQIWTGQSHEKK